MADSSMTVVLNNGSNIKLMIDRDMAAKVSQSLITLTGGLCRVNDDKGNIVMLNIKEIAALTIRDHGDR